MSITILAWTSYDPANRADHVLWPTEYFPELRRVTRRMRDGATVDDLLAGPLILGGSGLLHEDYRERVRQCCLRHEFPLIVWGIGTNNHGDSAQGDWLEELKLASLVGIRDFGGPHYYVPCPSCLHHGFETAKAQPVKHDVVIYDQQHYRINIGGTEIPRMDNREQNSMMQILDFLASGRNVLTSSYHGAYWAALLNRNVMVCNVFSNKFYFLKERPTFVTEQNWLDHLKSDTNPHPDYLEESQSLNRTFANRVVSMLKL